MAKDTSPLCFRLSPDDRRLIETVAAYSDRTVSDFAREVLVEAAAKVVRDVGADKIVQAIDERTDQMREDNRRALDAAAKQRSGPVIAATGRREGADPIR